MLPGDQQGPALRHPRRVVSRGAETRRRRRTGGSRVILSGQAPSPQPTALDKRVVLTSQACRLWRTREVGTKTPMIGNAPRARRQWPCATGAGIVFFFFFFCRGVEGPDPPGLGRAWIGSGRRVRRQRERPRRARPPGRLFWWEGKLPLQPASNAAPGGSKGRATKTMPAPVKTVKMRRQMARDQSRATGPTVAKMACEAFCGKSEGIKSGPRSIGRGASRSTPASRAEKGPFCSDDIEQTWPPFAPRTRLRQAKRRGAAGAHKKFRARWNGRSNGRSRRADFALRRSLPADDDQIVEALWLVRMW